MRSPLLLLLLSFVFLIVQHAHGQACNLKYFGASLSGAEFGDAGGDHALNPNPGTFSSNYIYPYTSEVSYFVGKGMNTFRLPFRWERLQQSLGGSFDSGEQSRLVSAVNSMTDSGAYVLLDPHNYARYNGKIISQSSGAVTDAHFADFWSKLASLFKSNSKVIFGLMNEPYNLDITTWAKTCNAAIAAIRATGATQLILVPGSGWTGAHSWQSNAVCCGTATNAVAMAAITDSGNNWAYEMHQYLDSDFSGTNPTCPDATTPTTLVAATTAFLRTNGYRAFLGEFGGSTSSTCYSAADNLLTHLEQNSDVWIGWTWWTAGPWWGSYFMSIEPSGSTDAGQYTNVLKNHICFSNSGTSPTKAPTKAPTSSSTTPAPTNPSYTTPAPTSSSSGSCQALWGQCGGSTWTGTTCCQSGSSCSVVNQYYSQCIPGSTTPAPTSPTTPAPTRSPTTPAPTAPAPVTPAPSGSGSGSGSCKSVWQQCGGKTFSGSTCCVSGNKCTYLSDWYSQCWPNNYHEQLHVDASSSENNNLLSKTTLLWTITGGIIGAVLTTFGGVFFYVRSRQRRSSFEATSQIPLTSI